MSRPANSGIAPPANGGRERLMDRRAFLGSLALGILGVPRVAPAQPARKVYRIGILGSSALVSEMVGPQPQNPSVVALLRGLQELGYIYGEHFVTETRSGDRKSVV